MAVSTGATEVSGPPRATSKRRPRAKSASARRPSTPRKSTPTAAAGPLRRQTSNANSAPERPTSPRPRWTFGSSNNSHHNNTNAFSYNNNSSSMNSSSSTTSHRPTSPHHTRLSQSHAQNQGQTLQNHSQAPHQSSQQIQQPQTSKNPSITPSPSSSPTRNPPSSIPTYAQTVAAMAAAGATTATTTTTTTATATATTPSTAAHSSASSLSTSAARQRASSEGALGPRGSCGFSGGRRSNQDALGIAKRKEFGCSPNVKFFICSHDLFRDALRARGWRENPFKKSMTFDLRWVAEKRSPVNIGLDQLLPSQIVSDFAGHEVMCCKDGLTRSLRDAKRLTGVSCESFFPRAFDMRCAQDILRFLADFTRTKARGILMLFLQQQKELMKRTELKNAAANEAAAALPQQLHQNSSERTEEDDVDEDGGNNINNNKKNNNIHSESEEEEEEDLTPDLLSESEAGSNCRRAKGGSNIATQAYQGELMEAGRAAGGSARAQEEAENDGKTEVRTATATARNKLFEADVEVGHGDELEQSFWSSSLLAGSSSSDDDEEDEGADADVESGCSITSGVFEDFRPKASPQQRQRRQQQQQQQQHQTQQTQQRPQQKRPSTPRSAEPLGRAPSRYVEVEEEEDDDDEEVAVFTAKDRFQPPNRRVSGNGCADHDDDETNSALSGSTLFGSHHGGHEGLEDRCLSDVCSSLGEETSKEVSLEVLAAALDLYTAIPPFSSEEFASSNLVSLLDGNPDSWGLVHSASPSDQEHNEGELFEEIFSEIVDRYGHRPPTFSSPAAPAASPFPADRKTESSLGVDELRMMSNMELTSLLESVLDEKTEQDDLCNGRNAWIIKPAAASQGKGIQVSRQLVEILQALRGMYLRGVCQKYLERPQLIYGYKFDIRLWVLVTSLNPLQIYIWRQPLLRFASQKYDDTVTDTNKAVHLTNSAVAKKTSGFNDFHEELHTRGYMWHRWQYEEWLHSTYCTRSEHCTTWLRRSPHSSKAAPATTTAVTTKKLPATSTATAATASRTMVSSYSTSSITTTATSAITPPTASPRSPDTASSSSSSFSCAPCTVSAEAPAAEAPAAEVAATAATAAATAATSSSSSSSSSSSARSSSLSARSGVGSAASTTASSLSSPLVGKTAAATRPATVATVGATAAATTAKCRCRGTACRPCENLWDTCIAPQMRTIVKTTIACCAASGMKHRPRSFALYGFDLIAGLDADNMPKLWLLEVNRRPDLTPSTAIKTTLLKKLFEDIAKVVVDRQDNPNADIGEWELLS